MNKIKVGAKIKVNAENPTTAHTLVRNNYNFEFSNFQLFWLLSPFVVRTEKSIFAQNFLKSYDSKLKGRVNVPCR
ncbi:MAG TPA: hypothetical protein VKY44_04260 [Flavobacterium sp.]|nr:hypothetical protein [Flavobacterium sp.]